MSVLGTAATVRSAINAETKRMEDVHIRQAALGVALDLIPETAEEIVSNARIIEAYLRGETESLAYRS